MPEQMEELFRTFDSPKPDAPANPATPIFEGQEERRDPFSEEEAQGATAVPMDQLEAEKAKGEDKGVFEGQGERRDPFSQTEAMGEPREMPGPPELKDLPPVNPDEVGTLIKPEEQVTEVKPADPAQDPLAPGQTDLEEIDKRWLDLYDTDAKTLVGEETYNKLKMISEKQLTPGQIIGLIGVMATNPEAAARFQEQFAQEKGDALSILATLERDTIRFKKEGLAQYAQTRRAEIKQDQVRDVAEDKIEASEYRQRVVVSEKMISEITAQGLPASVASTPTPEQLRDPDLFWTQWVPEFSRKVGSYLGKQQINTWLMSKDGPAWLANSALMDPAAGVMNRLQETGLYTPEELEIMNQTIIPEFTKMVGLKREREKAEVSRIEAQTSVYNATVDKLTSQVAFYDKKLEMVGTMSRRDQGNLHMRIQESRQKIITGQAKLIMYANHYSTLGDKKWATTIAGNLNAASQLDDVLAQLDLQEQLLLEEIGTEYMTVQQALPDAIGQAIQITMERQQGMFETPEEAIESFFGDENPGDPGVAQARTQFYINLLMLVQRSAGGNFHNVAELMNTGGPGDSYLDQAAGQDVTMPPDTSTQAAKLSLGPQ